MKKLKVFFAILAVGVFMPLMAQTEEERLLNTQLFQQNVKVGNYADAVEPWNWVYQYYPSSTLYIYAHGSKILAWQIAQAKTQEEKDALVEKLMKLYDDRIKYFGQNAKTPTPYILGLKALDYINYNTKDELKRDAYGWLEQAINGLGDRSQLPFVQQYFNLSTNIYKKDKTHGEKYLADFVKVSALLDTMMVKMPDKAETIAAVKSEAEQNFVSSGAADCAAVDAIFGKDLEANKNNQAWLNNALRFFKKLNCVDSDTYFKAAVYSHKISPSVESARSCADLALKNKEYAKTVDLLSQAADLSTSSSEKADIYFAMAQVYYSGLGNYTTAKTYCNKALENKSWGEPYILIATMYATNGNKIFGNDETFNATIYWAVVDKLERAKAVDPSCAANANRMIATYKQYYPKAEDVFMRPELSEKGKTFHIGGWVNENVICR
ncbi:MAG: hypothetical protein E7076_08280 [Bacteroidales bacterium]|nr:hypothetical protein [Bacteroidales bacterium]